MENSLVLTIDGVECYEKDGVAYLKLEAVARGLGFTTVATSGNEVVRWNTVHKYLTDLGVATSCNGLNYREMCPDFIPENVFYRLAMKAKNEAAEKFQAKVADEIIPSIRRHGAYVASQPVDTNQLSPEMQLILKMANSLAAKELEDKRQNEQIALAQKTAQAAVDTTEKIREEIIQPFDNWRTDIVAKVRQIAKASGIPYQTLFSDMYRTLERKAGCDLSARQRNKRKRMEAAGCLRSEIDSGTSKISVIGDDRRLKQIFEDIVRRYSVAHIA